MEVQTKDTAERRIATAPQHYAGLIDNPEPRFAVVRNALAVKNVEAYLPGNYALMESFFVEKHKGWGGTSKPIIDKELIVIIGGYDNAGWTLDDYVIPRLASGLIWAEEIA